MNILITPELEKFVQAQISSGMYQSTSELFRDALLLLVEREERRQKRLDKLNQEIQIAVDQAEQGIFISAEESKRRLDILMQKFSRDSQDDQCL